jgi:hypothetical protein
MDLRRVVIATDESQTPANMPETSFGMIAHKIVAENTR